VTVFVSYSSRDRDAVKSLTQDLQDADERVWMDQRLAGGEAWWRAILEQLRGCDVFIFALSQNSIESKPCQAELQYAQALGLPVLPVQVGAIDSMQLNPLATVQAIDYRHQTPNTGMRLIAALNRERARRQPLPKPLPEEPTVPFEYLIRLYTTISNPDYLTPRDQAALVAQLRVGLQEDGQHEAARNNIVTLLRKLHDREDATHRTRTDVEAIIASTGAAPPPGPPIATDTVADPEQPRVITQPSAPLPTDTGREPTGKDHTTLDPPTGTDPPIGPGDQRASRDSLEVPAPSAETTAQPPNRRLFKRPTGRRAAEVIFGPDLLKLFHRLQQARTRTKIMLGAVTVLVVSGVVVGAWISSHPTNEPSMNSLPGTDHQGWISYPAARCNPGNQPAVMARTTQSVLVVCQIQPGDFYYRGVRLSDGDSIELANVVRSSGGFDVTDPTDGTRYRLQPTSLTIARPNTQASSEPVLEYALG
jgi:hypothetical protein